MKIFKIWVIVLMVFSVNVDLSAQSCNFGMTIKSCPPSTVGLSNDNYCYTVDLATPTPADFLVSFDHCIITSNEPTENFSTVVCFGPDACGTDVTPRNLSKLIECGIIKDGNLMCEDGCTVTIEPND